MVNYYKLWSDAKSIWKSDKVQYYVFSSINEAKNYNSVKHREWQEKYEYEIERCWLCI